MIQEILKKSNYYINIFEEVEIKRLEEKIVQKEIKNKIVFYVRCLVRNRVIKLTPEEIVRQLFLDRLINFYEYPTKQIQVEYGVHFGRQVKCVMLFYSLEMKLKLFIKPIYCRKV